MFGCQNLLEKTENCCFYFLILIVCKWYELNAKSNILYAEITLVNISVLIRKMFISRIYSCDFRCSCNSFAFKFVITMNLMGISMFSAQWAFLLIVFIICTGTNYHHLAVSCHWRYLKRMIGILFLQVGGLARLLTVTTVATGS